MSELVAIGRVVKPHGIRGEVVVDVLTDVEGRFAAGTDVVLGGKPTTITGSRPHQGRLLVRFLDVPDRTAAEGLRGAVVEAEGSDLDDEDHFYAHELVGLRVLGPDGQDLGEVVDLVLLPSAAGYDLLEVVRDDGHRWLLPAADDLVEAQEAEDGTLSLRVVDLPEGLLDPAQAEDARSSDAADEA